MSRTFLALLWTVGCTMKRPGETTTTTTTTPSSPDPTSPTTTTSTPTDPTGAPPPTGDTGPSGPCPPGEIPGAFVESGGLLVIEAESSEPIGDGWVEVEADGVTYLEASNDHLGNTNGDERRFDLVIETPGAYRFHMKSRFTGDSSTDRNDTWFRLENTETVHFLTADGRIDATAELLEILDGTLADPAIYYPRGNALDRPDFGEENPGTNGYFKVYRSGNGGLSWHGRTIDNHGYIVYAYFGEAGTYSLSMKERSAGHRVDRFAFAHLDEVSSRVPEDELDGPESERRCEPE